MLLEKGEVEWRERFVVARVFDIRVPAQLKWIFIAHLTPTTLSFVFLLNQFSFQE